MDDFKKKQLQEFFTLLEDDSVSCQIDEDEECVLVDFPDEMRHLTMLTTSWITCPILRL